MARYTDIDNLIKIIQDQIIDTNPNDLGYKVLTQFIAALNHAPIADVAPRAEVARELLDEMEKTIRWALTLVGLSYKHNFKEIQCRSAKLYSSPKRKPRKLLRKGAEMVKFSYKYDLNKMVKCPVCKKEHRQGEFVCGTTPRMCKYCWAERNKK